MNCEADCPICLCPILSLSSPSSLPWGVSAPCGHAYHRECWDNVVANHHHHPRGRKSGRNTTSNTPCAICKGTTTGFVPVFIELGGGNPPEKDDMVSGVSDNSVDVDKEGMEGNDMEMEDIVEEWDELWNELEKLCNDDDDRETTTDDSSSSSSSALRRRRDREIERICDAIDLTQSSPPPKNGSVRDSTCRAKEEEQNGFGECRRRLNYDKINRTLTRLKAIHLEIRNMLSRPKSGGANHHQQQRRHIERLRSKISKLQLDNTELHCTTSKLQESNTVLSNRLAESEQISSDFIVEMERSKLKYESLHKQHQQSQNENARLASQYNHEKSTLTNTILKLRQQNKELMEDVALENIQELEEVRTRYSKMAQALHDAKMERNKAVLELTRRVQELEGRLDRKNNNDHALLLKCAKDEDERSTIHRSQHHSCNGFSDDAAASTRKAAPSKHRTCGSLGEELTRSGAALQPGCSSRSGGNRALDALNTTSSRKFPRHLEQPPPRRPYSNRHNSAGHHTSSSSPNEEYGGEPSTDNGVQLLMRTGDIRHRASKKRRSDDTQSGSHTKFFDSASIDGYNNYHGKENTLSSNRSVHAAMNSSWSMNMIASKELASTSTDTSLQRKMTAGVAVYSPSTKRQGGIKSYFKPA